MGDGVQRNVSWDGAGIRKDKGRHKREGRGGEIGKLWGGSETYDGEIHRRTETAKTKKGSICISC